MKDRRLIVLFYDLGSMQPEEVTRAVQSGRDYIEKKIAPADILAVVSLTTALSIDQDFTADRQALLAALNRLSPVEGSTAAASDRRRDRAGHRQRVRRGRHRVQHLQHGPPARRAAVGRRRARGHRAEEVDHLLQRRRHPVGDGQPGRAADARGPRGPRQRLDLRRRHAGTGGAAGRRRREHRPACAARAPSRAARCRASARASRPRRTR